MSLYNITLVLSILLSTMVNEPGKELFPYHNINSAIEVIELQEEIIEITKFNVDGLILKEGIFSEEVLRIKSFLKAKGYSDITEGSYFDSNTKDLIINYQASNGLESNGIINTNTYQKINEDMEFNKISISNIELVFSAEVPVGNWIIINKSNNTLYHLIGSELIRSYPVATGKTPSHTPEGKFTIVTRYINPAWGGAGLYDPIAGGAANNPLGKRWLGLNINGGGTYGIHGNADFGSIGKYVSLGCIRMYNHDVEVLYDLIEKDTPVWIGSETKFADHSYILERHIGMKSYMIQKMQL